MPASRSAVAACRGLRGVFYTLPTRTCPAVAAPRLAAHGAAGFGRCGRLRVAMGAEPGPAVRSCVSCRQLKSTGQFEPGRRKCRACRAAASARARDRAARRLALEHLDAYQQAFQAQLLAAPAGRPADRKQAGNQARSGLVKQHAARYQQLYRQELREHGQSRYPFGAVDLQDLLIGSPADRRVGARPPGRQPARPPGPLMASDRSGNSRRSPRRPGNAQLSCSTAVTPHSRWSLRWVLPGKPLTGGMPAGRATAARDYAMAGGSVAPP
jgi:hypothetical protein